MIKTIIWTCMSMGFLIASPLNAGNVSKLKSMWEQKAKEQTASPPAKESAPVGNNLGRITKECEDSTRARYYRSIEAECDIARKDPKKFDVFFKKYEKAAPKISGLRNLGEYDPDPAVSKQKALTKATMATKGEPIGRLTKSATCKKFAEHMSLVHPGNNDVFEATMKCVVTKKGEQPQTNAKAPMK